LVVKTEIVINSIVLVSIMLLSAFTHLWNPIGFPGLHPDEGHYMRKAMNLLEVWDLRDSPKIDNLASVRPYAHPYFGQLFLAGALGLIDYPALLNVSSNTSRDALHSVEMSYLFPRVLMGILAVADTFLIYKISERRYNRNIAIIASVLFAVMPITLMLRRIYLDSILLPFLLSSILFALYANDFKNNNNNNNRQTSPLLATNYTKKNILILLSGLFLGLAIFTKIPAFTMIPVIGLLIYTSSKDRKLNKLALWFIPVILLPSIWPAYAIITGEFGLWIDAVTWQVNRVEETHFDDAINAFFTIDPVLLVIGTAGLVFAAIKRDLWLLLWVVPFLIFSFIVQWVIVFHLIVLVPPLCIAAATLIQTLSMKVTKKKVQRLLPYVIISGIGIFGLISTINLITLNLNTAHLEANALLIKELSNISNVTDHNYNNTMVFGHRIYMWIPKFVYHKDFTYYDYDTMTIYPPEMLQRLIDEKALTMQQYISDASNKKMFTPVASGKKLIAHAALTINDSKIIWIVDKRPGPEHKQLFKIYNSTKMIDSFKENLNNYDRDRYPFNTLRWFKFTLGDKVEVGTN
jgi:Dolichyl-phosphate-mannose-protein mannosyltransferase